MPISVQPVNKSDIPRLVDIHCSSMAASGFFRSVGEIPDPNSAIPASTCKANKLSRLLNDWEADPTLHFLKVVDDDTGEILAFAKWHVYRGEEGLETWKAAVRTDESMIIPSGTNEEGFRFCFGKLYQRRHDFFGEGGKEHCLLALLATDPEYERRGAGSLLTKWGCEVADKYKIPCYLEASKKGYPIYKRLGFEEVSPEGESCVLQFDVSRFTGRGGDEGDMVYLTTMARKAPGMDGF